MNRMTAPKTFLTQAPPAAPVGPEEILEIEKRIEENSSAREKATGIREAKAGEIVTLRTQTPQDITARVARERRGLLAKIALGSAADADLAKFDRDAAEKQKAIAKQSPPKEAIEKLEQTVAGLDDEIGKLDAQGKALVAERHRVWGCYLREYANRKSAIAKEHAGISFQATCDVVMIGGILQRLEGQPNGIGLGAREFCFPTLGTPATELPPEKKSALGVDTNLYSIVSDANLKMFTGIAAEKPLFEEFERAGLKWPGPPPPPSTVDVAEPGMKKVPPGAATPVDPKNPDALRGPGWYERDLPISAIVE